MQYNRQYLYRFLNACEGNWRNAVFIQCSVCPFSEQLCPGYLLTADADGQPLLYSVEAFCRQTGEFITKDECIGEMSGYTFEQLYRSWLLWHTTSPRRCGIPAPFMATRPKQTVFYISATGTRNAMPMWQPTENPDSRWEP